MKKVFKTFLKMKYNRLSLFIYKKEFRPGTPRQCHSTTAHSTKGAPQQVQSSLALEKTSAHRNQEGKETPKKKENLKKKKIKLQHFKK